MAREPPDPSPQPFRPSEPRRPVGQDELIAVARCHQLCLPHTASSRAGLPVLAAMYAALGKDPAARIIWHPPGAGPAHLGGFAAGTVALRDTEVQIRRNMSAPLLARLAM